MLTNYHIVLMKAVMEILRDSKSLLLLSFPFFLSFPFLFFFLSHYHLSRQMRKGVLTLFLTKLRFIHHRVQKFVQIIMLKTVLKNVELLRSYVSFSGFYVMPFD